MTRLGKYELHEQLGKGGFGTVYRATDTTLDRVVALKVLHPQLMVDDIFINRFKKEARALAALENHHIVTIHEISEMDGRISIAMRYLAGGNLKQVIKNRGPLPLNKTLEIILQVLKGLKAAHEHGFIHRDLKPENILSDGYGEYVITDLGLVRDSQGSASSSTGGITGTPNYIAPEIWRGQPATPSTDIYSVGCILYELLTGRVLFEGDTPAYVMMKHLLEGPQLSGSFTPEVEDLLKTALAQDPADRFSSAEALSTALRNLSAPPAPASPPAQPAPTRSTEADLGESAIEFSEEELETQAESDREPQPVSPPADQPTPARESPEITREIRNPINWKKITPFIAGGVAIITLLVIGITSGWFTPSPASSSSTELPVIAGTKAPTYTVMLPTSTSLPPTATSVPPTPTEAYTIRTQVSLIDGMTMVYVPEGEFLMGSPDGVGDDDEHPQHKVYLDGYWIDQTEVTNAMYTKFLNENSVYPSYESLLNFSRAFGKISYESPGWYEPSVWKVESGYEDHPVVDINYDHAIAYCEWAGRQLPTEAQWEKAARGIDGRKYPWGNSLPTCIHSQYDECSGETIKAGTLLSGTSPYGALDMAGNVWEWVMDWYGDYSSLSATNPRGPTDGEMRVLRGGSWVNAWSSIYSQNRFSTAESYTFDYVGFRCALPASQESANGTNSDLQKTATEEPVTVQSESKTFEGTLTRDVKCRTGPDQYLYGYDVVLEPQEILIDGRNEEGTWMHFTTLDGTSECWTIREYIETIAVIEDLPARLSPNPTGQVFYGFAYTTCNPYWYGYNTEAHTRPMCENTPSCHIMLTNSTENFTNSYAILRFLRNNAESIYDSYFYTSNFNLELYTFPFTGDGISSEFYTPISISCPQMEEKDGVYILSDFMN